MRIRGRLYFVDAPMTIYNVNLRFQFDIIDVFVYCHCAPGPFCSRRSDARNRRPHVGKMWTPKHPHLADNECEQSELNIVGTLVEHSFAISNGLEHVEDLEHAEVISKFSAKAPLDRAASSTSAKNVLHSAGPRTVP